MTGAILARRRALLRQLMAEANLHAGQAVPPGSTCWPSPTPPSRPLTPGWPNRKESFGDGDL
jgi:hypothetical protein